MCDRWPAVVNLANSQSQNDDCMRASPFFTATLFLVQLLLGGSALSAQIDLSRAILLTKENGLPDDNVLCLAQDADGFLWIGTDHGLCRYDGCHFTHPGARVGVEGAVFGKLLKLDEERILAATNAGLMVVYPRQMRFQTLLFEAEQEYHLPANNILNIALTPHRRIVVLTNTAVHSLDFQLGDRRTLHFRPEDFRGGTSYFGLLITLPDGGVLVEKPRKKNYSEGFYQIDAAFENIKICTWELSSPFSQTYILQMSDTSALQIEYGGKASAHWIDLRNGEKTDVHLPAKSAAGKLTNLVKYGDEAFFEIGSNFYKIPAGSNLPEPIDDPAPDVKFNQILTASDGTTFVATHRGLWVVKQVQRAFRRFPAIDSSLTAMGFDAPVMDVCKLDGQYFIATYGRGLLRWDSAANEIRRLPLPDSFGIFADYLWNLWPHAVDTLWVGTSSGLCWYAPRSDSFGRVGAPGSVPAMHETGITTQFLSRGELWMGLGGGHGATVFNLATRRFRHYPATAEPPGLPFRYPKAICEAPDGDLWMGCQTGGGLVRWHRSVDSFSVVYPDIAKGFDNDQIDAIAADHAGNIWFGTRGAGLRMYDPASRRFRKWTSADGLSDDYIECIFIDAKGIAWIGTPAGLNRFDPATNQFSVFNKSHGLPGNEISHIEPWDESGRILFIGCNRGFCLLLTDSLSTGNRPFRLSITRVSVNDLPIEQPPTNHLRLRYFQNNIDIEFSAVNFVDGALNSYFYKMGDENEKWIELGNHNELRLAGLGPGSYSIHLKACMNGGICIESRPILIDIRPPFWKSIWFYLLITLLVAAAIATYYRLSLRTMIKEQSLRNEISADLHDDIGASLSSIHILSSFAGNPDLPDSQKSEILKSINEEVKNINHSLEEIIWSIHPGNDSMEKIRWRMQRYANELLEAKGIAVHWSIPEAVYSLNLPIGKRREFFLIFKEAVNNLAKHADCRNAWISLSQNGKTIQLCIRDDGRGFDPGGNYNTNGLRTMYERAEKLKGQLVIESRKSAGTEIRLAFPAH